MSTARRVIITTTRNRHAPRIVIAGLLGFLLPFLFTNHPVAAQEDSSNPEEAVGGGVDEGNEESRRSLLMFGPEDKPKQFLPLPLFIQNPTLGTGFGLALTVMFKTNYDDPDSPFSLVTVPGFYTNSQSFFVGSFTVLYMLENRLRVMGGAGYGQVNNEYQYTSSTLDREISYTLFFGRVAYAFWPRIYLGGAYQASYIAYRKFEVDSIPVPIENSFSSGIFLHAEYDSRDSVYNPMNGISSNIDPGFFPTWLGSDNTYITLDLDFNWYWEFVRNLVFAYRAAGSHAFLDVPYSSLPTLGKGSDLRGYQTGQYRGSNLFTTQAELRWTFWKGLGVAGFGGVGFFYGSDPPSFIRGFDGIPFPSVGFGPRYVTSDVTGMVIRVDFAWGKGGDFGWYFQLGQAF